MAARRKGKPTKSASRSPMFAQLVLAKKLRRMILNRIAAESDIGEVELTALLLVNELLGHKDR